MATSSITLLLKEADSKTHSQALDKDRRILLWRGKRDSRSLSRSWGGGGGWVRQGEKKKEMPQNLLIHRLIHRIMRTDRVWTKTQGACLGPNKALYIQMIVG